MPADPATDVTPLLIAGGGIGGLAAALALARRGIASHLIEARPAFDDEGAGIQLGPNATRILSHLGAADSLREMAGQPDDIRVLDGATARSLVVLPLGAWIAARHGAPYWVVHRSDLHGALLAQARRTPLIRLSMGSGVMPSLDHGRPGEGVVVRTDQGHSYAGRGLVAADGLWSRLRTAVFSDQPLEFTGRCAARTVIATADAPPALRANATFVWLAQGAHVVHYPVRSGRAIAVVVIVTETEATRDWSRAVPGDWIADRTLGFHGRLRELLGAAAMWRKWSLHALPALPPMSSGVVALLGDAAHPILPFLAQGGALALEDAIVLADCAATQPSDLTAAFARYATLRRGRAQSVAAASRRNGQVYHLGGAAAAARNMAMPLLGGRRIMTGYDWLYGWPGRGSGPSPLQPASD